MPRSANTGTVAHARAVHVRGRTAAPRPSPCVFSLHPSSTPKHWSPQIALGELDGSAEMERPVGLHTSFADRDAVPPTSPAPAAGPLDRADPGSRAGQLPWQRHRGGSM